MPSFIQAVKNSANGDGRKTAYDKKPDPITGFKNLTTIEKLATLVTEIRQYDQPGRQRRNTVYYKNALYYQGYQNIGMSSDGTSLEVYDKPDYYIENQYRRHVDAVKNMLNDMEPDTIARPTSDKPKDIAAARAADPALDIIRTNIAYDRLKDTKNLYKVLFGTSFQFTDYIVDKKYGTSISPKYRYEEQDLEGEMVMSKVLDGYDERDKGQEVAMVYSPLEVHVPTNIKGGVENLPWLQLYGWHDIDTINYVYPGLNEGAGSAVEDSLAKDYLSILGGLQGNTLGADGVVSVSLENQGELARTWITPVKFRNDPKLLKEFPEGVHVTTVNGKVVDHYAEKLCDHWTIEVLIPLPHSMLGDGLTDVVSEQDQINMANSLILRHILYSTVGHKIYNADIIDPKDVVNDPANGWIPARPGIDQRVMDAVQDVRPNTLGAEVVGWLQMRKETMQDISSAHDPVTGKGLGANTPYSQSVFLAEKAQSRWKSSSKFNQPELMRFWRQLLKIAQTEWLDPRTKALVDNTGQWSFAQFTAADLEGGVDIYLTNTDFKPKSRAEQMQGLEQRMALEPIWLSLPPRQRLKIEESLGMPPDTNPLSNQVMRAFRMIERVKLGEVVTPLPLVDEPEIQVPVIKDWLVSEEGEQLALENPEAYSNVYTLMVNLITMGMMAMAQGIVQPGQPQQNGPGGQPQSDQKGTPGGQPGQQGGGPKAGAGQELAQSPVRDKQPAPPVAAGAR